MKLRVLSILLFFLPLSLAGQTGEWDAALDRYESITVECVRMKNELAGGGDVSLAGLRRLAVELDGLKGQLQKSSGKMTAAQRFRLAQIRRMYAEGTSRSTAAVKILPVEAPFSLFPDPPAVRTAHGPGLARPHIRNFLAAESVNGRAAAQACRYFAMLSAGIVPDLSCGAMAGRLWSRWGFYASARSNFISPHHAFECHSDGSVPDGSIIWTSGKSKVSRLNLTAGALWHPAAWGTLYFGGGYGRRMLLWQDSGGEWAAVSDCSNSGIALDAGIMIHYGRMLFSTGASAIPSTSGKLYADISLGLGWLF